MRSLPTRRQIAALLAATPLAAQVTTTPPAGSPAPAKPSATPEQRLAKAYADVRDVSNRLTRIEVPYDLEPAFTFRA
ncbi:MAG TPA: hypothetical protein VKX25_18135 [Bryobacteraceae bacterium]|jgi:hypothetical protein|nr:hypothetical protein [Bryobacteraceae bacterium]